jgi:collagenase-like PrtC family protease
VGHGADVVVLNGRSSVDEAGGRDASFGLVRADSFADAIESCMARAVEVRLALVGAFPLRRFADILDLAAAMAEMGVSQVELSDPGLAVAFRQELPDMKLVANGMLAHNSAAAVQVARAGFSSISLDSTVPVGDAAAMARASGIDAEVQVFGPRPVAWCHACMAGEYLDSKPCNGSAFGPCHRKFLATGGGAGVDGRVRRWMDTGFYSGLLLLPEICNADIATVRIEVDQRRAARAGDVTAVFRDAIDAGARAMEEGGDVPLTAAMYPRWAPQVWTAMLIRASMYDDVTPTTSGNGVCAAVRPGAARSAAWPFGPAGCAVVGRVARFLEPLATGAEDKGAF